MRLSTPAAAVLAATLPAQIDYEPNIGAVLTTLPLNDEAVFTGNALGFSFTWPGGTVSTTADVSINGRITPGNSGVCPTPFSDLQNFLSGPRPTEPQCASSPMSPPTIAPYFRDWDFDVTGAGDLYFNALPGKAVFTWVDAAPSWPLNSFCTVQCQLLADGRIWFVFDERLSPAAYDAIIGLTSGGTPPDPGETDLSTAAAAPIATSGVATVYEMFSGLGLSPPLPQPDLAGFGIEFAPDGTGGWVVTAREPVRAGVASFGQSCEKAILFQPDGSGGYVVLQDFGRWDPNIGNMIIGGPTATDDAESSPQNLGFSFPMPGGSTETLLAATDNGRIVPPNRETLGYFLPPGFAEWALLNKPYPSIAAFWTAIDPAAGGGVFFNALPGLALFTWQDVSQSGAANALTFQAQLRPDGSIVVVLRSISQFTNGSDALVGVSEGGGTSPFGESSLNNLPVFSGSSVYEFIRGQSGDTNEWQAGLGALTAPVLGASFDLQLVGIAPGSTGAFVLVGFEQLNIDLTPFATIGLPGCSLYVNAVVSAPVAFTGSVSSVLALPVPIDPNGVGLEVFLQGVVQTPGATPSGLVLTNGIRGVLGP